MPKGYVKFSSVSGTTLSVSHMCVELLGNSMERTLGYLLAKNFSDSISFYEASTEEAFEAHLKEVNRVLSTSIKLSKEQLGILGEKS